MFRKEIKFIYDFNLNKVRKLGSYLTYEQIRKTEIHPAILHYISAEIDYLIFEDRQKILKDSVFDYSGETISGYFNQIAEEVKKNKRFSIEYIAQLILHSASFTVNYLARPRWALMKLIFEDDEHKSTTEIKQILNYVYYYSYLKKIITSYINRKKILSLNYDEFEELLNKIDDLGFKSDFNVILESALHSMANFFNIGETHKHLIPLQSVELFLREKGLTAHLMKLRDYFPQDEKLVFDLNDYQKAFNSIRHEESEEVEGFDPDLVQDEKAALKSEEEFIEREEAFETTDLMHEESSGIDIKIDSEEETPPALMIEKETNLEEETYTETETPQIESERIDSKKSDKVVEFQSDDITDKHKADNAEEEKITPDDSQFVTESEAIEPEAIVRDKEVEVESVSNKEMAEESAEIGIEDVIEIDENELETGASLDEFVETESLRESGKDIGQEEKGSGEPRKTLGEEAEELVYDSTIDADTSIEEESVIISEIFADENNKTDKVFSDQEISSKDLNDKKTTSEKKETLTESTSNIEDEPTLFESSETQGDDSKNKVVVSIEDVSESTEISSVQVSGEESSIGNDDYEKPKLERKTSKSDSNETTTADQNKITSEKEQESYRQSTKFEVSELLERKNMTRVIDVIFDYDIEEFAYVIDKACHCSNFKEAMKVLNELYENNQISTSSKEAETLNSIISDYFSRKEN